jgi:AcrR family transcriptional regulator
MWTTGLSTGGGAWRLDVPQFLNTVTDGGRSRNGSEDQTMTTTEVSAPVDTRHAGLERDDVVDAALALVEADGPEALTMRKVAAELGVAPTTIYWHVGNRDALVLAVIQRQAERQAASRVRGVTPHERVAAAARTIWRSALANRNVTALANQAGATTLLELPLELALLAELEVAGIRGAPARDALRSILACIAGFLVIAWRREHHIPDELRAGSLWASVDDDRLSADTRAALAEPSDVDLLFEDTLDAVVRGILDGTPRTNARKGQR